MTPHVPWRVVEGQLKMTPFDTICYLRTCSSKKAIRAGDVGARVGNISSNELLNVQSWNVMKHFGFALTQIFLFVLLSLVPVQKKILHSAICFM